jgi:hypothetical protein
MVAPIQHKDKPAPSSAMRRAHRLVASTLLSQAPAADGAPRVAAWKAWLFAAWVVVIAAAYVAHVARIW